MHLIQLKSFWPMSGIDLTHEKRQHTLWAAYVRTSIGHLLVGQTTFMAIEIYFAHAYQSLNTHKLVYL